MAVVYLGSGIVGAGAVLNGDIYILQDFAILSNTGSGFQFGAFINSDLIVGGSIIAELDGITSGTGSSLNGVIIEATGSVFGQSDGIEMRGDFHTVTVNGQVVGNGDNGVEFLGNGNELENNGAISGFDAGVVLDGDNNRLTNTGTIFGDNGVELAGLSNGIVNTGTITGSDSGLVFNTTIEELSFVQNAGTIGTSFPGGFAILGGLGVDGVFNTGTILGSVVLGQSDDVYDGRGGEITDRVDGGSGNDILIGGDGGERLLGDAGADRLNGNGGDDTLEGGGSSDMLYGGSGDDDLNGGSGGDVLRGGGGEDTLAGGNGADILIGGTDNDTLTGGSGADIFVIAPETGSDVISDFEDGVDLVDLTAFGLRPALFGSVVDPLLTNAGGATSLDLAGLGGSGILLIEGLSIGDADAGDFIL